jgi:hypothetical protein
MTKIYLVALLLLGVLASCTLAPDHCLHMSDCGDGTTCVEGLCVGGSAPPAETLSTTADASSLPTTDASTPPITTPIDAALIDASDAGDASDGALTDASSD